MTQPIQIIPNIGLKSSHKFILYVASIIFLASLVVPIKGIDVQIIQNNTLPIMIWGVLVWIIIDIFTDIGSTQKVNSYGKDESIPYYVASIVTQIIYFFITLLIIVL